MKFRKKPVVVEAIQVTRRMHIETLEGTMVADIGDWLITGAEGEQYPCKDAIFAKTYEALEPRESHEEGIAVSDSTPNDKTPRTEAGSPWREINTNGSDVILPTPRSWYNIGDPSVIKVGAIFDLAKEGKATVMPVIQPGESYSRLRGGWDVIYESVGRTILAHGEDVLLDTRQFTSAADDRPLIKLQLFFKQISRK